MSGHPIATSPGLDTPPLVLVLRIPLKYKPADDGALVGKVHVRTIAKKNSAEYIVEVGKLLHGVATEFTSVYPQTAVQSIRASASCLMNNATRHKSREPHLHRELHIRETHTMQTDTATCFGPSINLLLSEDGAVLLRSNPDNQRDEEPRSEQPACAASSVRPDSDNRVQ